MPLWAVLVDVVRAGVFATAHLMGGSVGLGIFAFSLGLRLAMLPLTLRTARQFRENAERLKRLKPELDRLKVRYANDKAKLGEATFALHRKHGVKLFPISAGQLVQLPVSAAMYQVARTAATGRSFLWIRDLARPDVALAVMAAGVTGLAMRFSGADNPRATAIVSATITFLIAWRLSAGVGLTSLAWSTVSAGEGWLSRTSYLRPRESR